MEYAVILGVMAAVVGVKAYTMLSLGGLEKEVQALRAEDNELTKKIDALDGTRTQLERDHKDILADLDKLDNTKNQLVVSIQKFGAVPVQEPTLERPPSTEHPEPVAAKTGGTGAEGDEAPVEEGVDVDVEDQDTQAETEAEVAAEGDAVGAEEVDRGEEDRRSILIVDDNADLRDLLAEALGRSYDVERAADGLEALDLILKKGRVYDAVLTDLNMPTLDGMTFLDHIPDDTRVIVMSAYLDRPEFAAAVQHPRVSRTVTKPFKLGEMKEAVAVVVDAPAEKVQPAVVERADAASE